MLLFKDTAVQAKVLPALLWVHHVEVCKASRLTEDESSVGPFRAWAADHLNFKLSFMIVAVKVTVTFVCP